MAAKKPQVVVVGGGYLGALVAHDAKLTAVRALDACGRDQHCVSRRRETTGLV